MKFVDIYKEVTALMDASEYEAGQVDSSAVDAVAAGLNSGLRWLAAKAPAWMLGGSDTANTATGFIGTLSATVSGGKCTVTLPDNFSRVMRVKCKGWHKAVGESVEETSDEYLMLNDATASATADRPVVAVVNGTNRQLEIYPSPASASDATVEVILYPSDVVVDLGVHVGNYNWQLDIPLPPRVKTSLLYYVASVVCMAWGNPLYKELMAMAENSLK